MIRGWREDHRAVGRRQVRAIGAMAEAPLAGQGVQHRRPVGAIHLHVARPVPAAYARHVPEVVHRGVHDDGPGVIHQGARLTTREAIPLVHRDVAVEATDVDRAGDGADERCVCAMQQAVEPGAVDHAASAMGGTFAFGNRDDAVVASEPDGADEALRARHARRDLLVREPRVPHGNAQADDEAAVGAPLEATALLQRHHAGVACQDHISVEFRPALDLGRVTMQDNVVLDVPDLRVEAGRHAMSETSARGHEGHDIPALERDVSGVPVGALHANLLAGIHIRVREDCATCQRHPVGKAALLALALDGQLSERALKAHHSLKRCQAWLVELLKVLHGGAVEVRAIHPQGPARAPLAATPVDCGHDVVRATDQQHAADLRWTSYPPGLHVPDVRQDHRPIPRHGRLIDVPPTRDPASAAGDLGKPAYALDRDGAVHVVGLTTGRLLRARYDVGVVDLNTAAPDRPRSAVGVAPTARRHKPILALKGDVAGVRQQWEDGDAPACVGLEVAHRGVVDDGAATLVPPPLACLGAVPEPPDFAVEAPRRHIPGVAARTSKLVVCAGVVAVRQAGDVDRRAIDHNGHPLAVHSATARVTRPTIKASRDQLACVRGRACQRHIRFMAHVVVVHDEILRDHGTRRAMHPALALQELGLSIFAAHSQTADETRVPHALDRAGVYQLYRHGPEALLVAQWPQPSTGRAEVHERLLVHVSPCDNIQVAVRDGQRT
mmetsp:Transcript_13080/g.37629  ORF Transcript_13080/g.37629 Transcript_13080/m.37629 type:complete len:724 (-) Transcript_13080:220-2391(-)